MKPFFKVILFNLFNFQGPKTDQYLLSMIVIIVKSLDIKHQSYSFLLSPICLLYSICLQVVSFFFIVSFLRNFLHPVCLHLFICPIGLLSYLVFSFLRSLIVLLFLCFFILVPYSISCRLVVS